MKPSFHMLLMLLLFNWFIAQSLWGQSYPDEAGFQQRSAILIEQIACRYQPPASSIGDAEKYYWPKAMARLQFYGLKDSTANAWIDFFQNEAPFHFTLVGMARLMYLFPKAAAMQQTKEQYLRQVFAVSNSDNAWWGEGTENHLAMARTSAYLYAQAAQGTIPTATMQMKLAKDWLLAYTRRIREVGNGEWNSSIYNAYSIVAWLNIYDFAEDPQLKKAAQLVLDYYALDMGLHYSFGILGGPEMRGNGVGVFPVATHFLAWLWFGQNPVIDFSANREYIQSIHAATSTYRPPALALKLADKSRIQAGTYHLNRPDYLLEQAGFVQETFYVHPQFTLGSCRDTYGGWTGSTVQMVPWKLVLAQNNALPWEVSGNGRYYELWSGRSRNPFTQVLQADNVLFQLTQTPVNLEPIQTRISQIVEDWAKAWQRDFVQRFPASADKKNVVNLNKVVIAKNQSYLTLPADVSFQQKGNCFLVNFGSVYLACTALGDTVFTLAMEGRQQLIVQAPRGQCCGWVLEVVSGVPDFAQFCQEWQPQMLRMESQQGLVYHTRDGRKLRARFVADGTFQEASVDWGFGPTEKQAIGFARAKQPSPFHQSAWPQGDGFGRSGELWQNRRKILPLQHRYLFKGPLLKLKQPGRKTGF